MERAPNPMTGGLRRKSRHAGRRQRDGAGRGRRGPPWAQDHWQRLSRGSRSGASLGPPEGASPAHSWPPRRESAPALVVPLQDSPEGSRSHRQLVTHLSVPRGSDEDATSSLEAALRRPLALRAPRPTPVAAFPAASDDQGDETHPPMHLPKTTHSPFS